MTMHPIRIVTDSAVRFPRVNFSGRELVSVSPMTIRVDAEVIEDRLDLDLIETRYLFEGKTQLPSAEPPSVQKLVEIYSQLLKETDQIISVHTSSSISKAYNHACKASQQFMGRCDIQVIDSLTVCTGLGFLVQAAAEAASKGSSFDDVIRIVRSLIPHLYSVYFLDDLRYLEHHGLVSRSQAILGNMLGIIPFLTMENGEIITMEKVRSRIRAHEKLIEFVSEFSEIEGLAILRNSESTGEEAIALSERLRLMVPNTPIYFSDYGPTLATFIGLNGLGVVVLERGEEG